jgi:hypothetical protein
VPIEPLAKRALLPHVLTARLSISPGVMELVSLSKRELMARGPFAQEFTWTIRLLEKVSPIAELDDPNFAPAVAEARANRRRMDVPKH